MTVTVSSDRPIVSYQGSIVIFRGQLDDREVRFAVDHRMAQDLLETVVEAGELDCDVEDWQIVSWAS